MKVKSLLLALTPLLLWFVIGSHAVGGETATERPLASQDVAMLTLTAADNGKTVAGRVGDEIAVDLSENPTTGFVWMVDPSDNEHFTEVATEFTPGLCCKNSGRRKPLWVWSV